MGSTGRLIHFGDKPSTSMLGIREMRTMNSTISVTIPTCDSQECLLSGFRNANAEIAAEFGATVWRAVDARRHGLGSS